MVEGAIVMGVLCILLMGMFEVGLMLMRINSLDEAARRLSRAAVTHGARSSANRGVWGPTTMSYKADASHPIAAEVRPYLIGISPSEVEIRLEWPDGHNRAGGRVRVTLECVHRQIAWNVLGNGQRTLRRQSTLRISH
jgi:hypothetical protein